MINRVFKVEAGTVEKLQYRFPLPASIVGHEYTEQDKGNYRKEDSGFSVYLNRLSGSLNPQSLYVAFYEGGSDIDS